MVIILDIYDDNYGNINYNPWYPEGKVMKVARFPLDSNSWSHAVCFFGRRTSHLQHLPFGNDSQLAIE